MTDSTRLSVAEELAQLRAEVRQLRAEMGTQGPTASAVTAIRPRGSWRNRAAVVAGVALSGATLMSVALASTPGHPADVTFIPLSVPHKILANAAVGKATTNSQLVIGGGTTVPTDATSVQMTVSVKSTAAGSLSVFPADHATSTTADTINFPAGNVLVTQVTKQSPGLNSKVSFKNNGTATAVLTVTITGYSTQTTASNISGFGGTAGQVLVNTGAGAAWRTTTLFAHVTSFGVISRGNATSVTSDGTGLYTVHWAGRDLRRCVSEVTPSLDSTTSDSSFPFATASANETSTDAVRVFIFANFSGSVQSVNNGFSIVVAC